MARLEINGTLYEMDDSLADSFLKSLAVKKPSLSRRVISAAAPILKSGVKMLTQSTHPEGQSRGPMADDHPDRFWEGVDHYSNHVDRMMDSHDYIEEYMRKHDKRR